MAFYTWISDAEQEQTNEAALFFMCDFRHLVSVPHFSFLFYTTRMASPSCMRASMTESVTGTFRALFSRLSSVKFLSVLTPQLVTFANCNLTDWTGV